jgi:endoglucanase
MNLKETIFALSSAEGVTGHESAATVLAQKLLAQYAADASVDVLGSVTGTVGEGDKTIMLDAYLDQIHMVVTSHEDRGFVRIASAGGMDRRVLIGKPVTIFGHGVNPIHAIVSSVPPHLASKGDTNLPDITELLIDTGLSVEQTHEMIGYGDPVIVDYQPQMLLNGLITGPALKNRCGVAAILRCLDLLKDEQLPCKVAVTFSAFGESNKGGAQTSAFRFNPEEAIVVDAVCAQQPGTPADVRSKMGKGTVLCISSALNRKVALTLRRLAKEQNIPCQELGKGGHTGTNADTIYNSVGGVATGLLMIPMKNTHTAVEIVDAADVECTAQLLAAYIRNGGRDNG